MKILITGANGFIGKNLYYALKNRGYDQILVYHSFMELDMLEKFCKTCEFVFHLAGVNRPQMEVEYEQGNVEFTNKLLCFLAKHQNTCPIMYASSIQAECDNPYGKSKKKAEQFILAHGNWLGARTLIYRLENVFGKWSQPNYNSVIATFCYNLARNLPIVIDNPLTQLDFVYIDDVVDELILGLEGKEHRKNDRCFVPIHYQKNVGDIANKIEEFVISRKNLMVPNQADEFSKKLYSTYLSYLPKEGFKYDLNPHVDQRGSFTEFLKTKERGQISINVSKPHVIKGNHWHNTKHEKFLVVSGKGVVRFRKPHQNQIIKIEVSGDKLEVVDIPPGYTHNIENVGESDMVTVMWVNEIFDPEHPDTYYLEV